MKAPTSPNHHKLLGPFNKALNIEYMKNLWKKLVLISFLTNWTLNAFLTLNLTFDQTNPNPKIGPTPANSPRKVMQCIGIFKAQFYGVVEDFKLNLP
jgi:hypothetical protein